jgi:predicted transcriptional regulator
MNTKAILGELKAERTRIDRAIQALESLGDAVVTRKPGRPKGGTSFEFGANVSKGRGDRRKMSAAGRRKISEMMKARWAARRKAKT